MQGAASPDPATVFVDARALRNDRVTLVEKGAPHSISLMESGKVRLFVYMRDLMRCQMTTACQ